MLLLLFLLTSSFFQQDIFALKNINITLALIGSFVRIYFFPASFERLLEDRYRKSDWKMQQSVHWKNRMNMNVNSQNSCQWLWWLWWMRCTIEENIPLYAYKTSHFIPHSFEFVHKFYVAYSLLHSFRFILGFQKHMLIGENLIFSAHNSVVENSPDFFLSLWAQFKMRR